MQPKTWLFSPSLHMTQSWIEDFKGIYPSGCTIFGHPARNLKSVAPAAAIDQF
jgi:hypothetical protein